MNQDETSGVKIITKKLPTLLSEENKPTLTASLDAGKNDIFNVSKLEVQEIKSPALFQLIDDKFKEAVREGTSVSAPVNHGHPDIIVEASKIMDEKIVAAGLNRSKENKVVSAYEIQGLKEFIADSIAQTPGLLHDHVKIEARLQLLGSSIDSLVSEVKSVSSEISQKTSAVESRTIDSLNKVVSSLEALRERLNLSESKEHEVKVSITEAPADSEATIIKTDKTYIYISDLPSYTSLKVTDANGEEVEAAMAGKGNASMVIFNTGLSPYTITLQK